MKSKTLLTVILTVALGAIIVSLTPATSNAADKAAASQKILYYTCPMHPDVRADKPGDCPVCGMHLVPVYEIAGTNAPATSTTNSPAKMSCCGAACAKKP